LDKKIEQGKCVVKIRILRWISGVTKYDRIRNEYVRERIKVASIVDKMRKNRLRWFIMRREDLEALRTVMELSVDERRGRRKLKNWLNAIECNMKTDDVCVNDVGDRVKWRRL